MAAQTDNRAFGSVLLLLCTFLQVLVWECAAAVHDNDLAADRPQLAGVWIQESDMHPS